MEEKRFTPGPWEVVDDDHHGLGTDSSVLIESTSRGITLAIVGPGDSTTYTEDMVNAQLIAAAPELLEALQEFSRQYGRLWDTVNPANGGFLTPESVVEYDRIHQLATAAIAKALGKE